MSTHDDVVSGLLGAAVKKKRGRPRLTDINGDPVVKKPKVRPPFEMRVIKVMRSEKVDEKNRIDMHISRWKLAAASVLEKRRIFTLPNGEERMLKQVGFNESDIKFIIENHKEIQETMEANREWKKD
jgi:hypothetical protein